MSATASAHPVSSRVRRGLAVLGVGGALMLLAAGCRPQPSGADDGTQAVLEFEPAPPGIGPVRLQISLTDAAGQPMRLGGLEVEGNMNHAGMRPVFARLTESAPGRYAGTIEFTMGGDWFLLLAARRPDGSRFERRIDVQVRAVELCTAEASAAPVKPAASGQ